MTKKTYNLLLDDKVIGTTELENSDAPMGVVFGNIKLNDTSSPYEFFKSYCVTNGIEILNDYPEDKLIATSDIPKLKIISSNGVEIKGQGTSIDGMDSGIFEVTILGVPYPFYEEEFPHHMKVYENRFKGNR
jgi:hypothetical protein